ncbi:hypothetical protein B0A49_07693 [Cryomyces minteri]|uniref:Branched-chain-amino-acid aminotransferase n=1 Tax=Cryomyces minteri TaxID=331657 RepID=A0A4U0X8F1_9PEZI|nr:hypothetical protein B0A49_07693 [Cryomyces minteri]
MSLAAITPPSSSGTATPTSTSALTTAGISASLQKTAPSLFAQHGTSTPLADLDASLLHATHTTAPRAVPGHDSAETAAQRTCTDHMVTARWTLAHGWEAPELKPYGALSIMPNASVLHYATECFEGMKLYRGHDGRLRLFRPDRNAARMLTSAARIALPAFPPVELIKLVTTLCATDGPKWLPKTQPGHFLYIRPTMIATDAALGVQRPKEALLYVILACFPDMTVSASSRETGKSGLRLLASNDDTVRAWPGGFGFAKVGANYGPSLVAQGEARARGYDQILWLFGDDCGVTEAGASNFFVAWETRDGKMQLVTAPLDAGIILDGVTRRSVLELARTRLTGSVEGLAPLEVVERRFTMAEVVLAADEGRLVEAFAAGTAFFIAPVAEIHFRGKDLTVPMGADGKSGPYAKCLKGWLQGIMYGRETHEWGVVVDEMGV